MRKNLRQNFGYLLAGQVIFTASQWGLIMVLARFSGVEAVGIFSLALAITTPLMFFGLLGQSIVYVTDKTHTDAWDTVTQLRRYGLLAMVGVCIGVAFFYKDTPVLAMAIVMMAVTKGVEGVSNLAYARAQKQHNMRPTGISLAMRGALGFGFFAGIIMLGGTLLWAMVAYALTWGVVLKVYDMRYMPALPKLVKNPFQKRFLPFFTKGMMVALGISLTLLVHTVPRVEIQAQMGIEAMGYFSAVAYFILVGMMFLATFNQAVRPLLSEAHHGREWPEFWRLVGISLAIPVGLGVAFSAVVWGFGAQVLTLFYGADYALYAPLFLSIALSSIVLYVGITFGSILNSMQVFWANIPMGVGTILVGYLTTPWLVATYGLAGGVISLALMGGVLCLLGALVMGWCLLRARA